MSFPILNFITEIKHKTMNLTNLLNTKNMNSKEKKHDLIQASNKTICGNKYIMLNYLE